jgi:hypothetical protein
VFNPTDPLTLLRHNPLWQFVTFNAVSMTLVGVISLVDQARAERRIREWTFVPGLALLVLSVAAYVGHALPSHTFWRIPAVWGLLLLPFASRWITGARESRGGLDLRTTLLVLMVAVPSILHGVDMTRHSAMRPYVVELGRELDARLRASGEESRVLLENGSVDFIHVVVASQNPSAFVLTEPVTSAGTATILPVRDLTREDLLARGVRFLVLREDSTVSRLERSAGIEESGYYGPWRLFELQRGER